MRRVAFLFVLAGLAMHTAIPHVPQVVGQEPAPGRAGSEFAGKVVAVNVRLQSGGQFTIMHNAGIRRLGQKEFLVGEPDFQDAATQKDLKGTMLWLALDNVESVTVFDDREKAYRFLGPVLEAMKQGATK